jgi:hypothetical protein
MAQINPFLKHTRTRKQVALWEAVAAASYNRYVTPAAKLLTDK